MFFFIFPIYFFLFHFTWQPQFSLPPLLQLPLASSLPPIDSSQQVKTLMGSQQRTMYFMYTLKSEVARTKNLFKSKYKVYYMDSAIFAVSFDMA